MRCIMSVVITCPSFQLSRIGTCTFSAFQKIFWEASYSPQACSEKLSSFTGALERKTALDLLFSTMLLIPH